jgi:hypothetical protein
MRTLPSLPKIILGTGLTLVVMVLALLPPILHFLTGPVGPGIGGFIAGRAFRLSDREAAVMGALLALATGLPAYLLLGGIVDNTGFDIVVAVVAAAWSGGIATVAAWFAGGEEEEDRSAAATD